MSKGNEAALREIQRRLQQGNLEAAAAGYEALIAAQPDDWTAINALGDLYIRLGDDDRGLAQITRVADHFYAEGFLPKAAALYRKVLKVRPDDHALATLAEIATQTKLVGEAKQYLTQLEQLRRGRWDTAGADECLARLEALGALSRESRAAAAQGALPAAVDGPPGAGPGQTPSAETPLEAGSHPAPAAASGPDAQADPPDPMTPAATPSPARETTQPPSLQSVFDRLRENAEQAGDLPSAREGIDRTPPGSGSE